MSVAILYVENGDVIADFERLEEARAALQAFLAEHPPLVDRVAVLEFGADGRPMQPPSTAVRASSAVRPPW